MIKNVIISLILFPLLVFTQQKGDIVFKIVEAKNTSSVSNCFVVLEGTNIGGFTNQKGVFIATNVPFGSYDVRYIMSGYRALNQKLILNKQSININATLEKEDIVLDVVEVKKEKNSELESGNMNDVEGVIISSGKKTEQIKMDRVMGNKATNTSRQVFAKVPGLTIWESDGAGIQLGIGGRGLNPSRTANFNTRQNGYDISADALGYPESYYTPPSEAVEKIQLIRGAASLQFGSQFGGLLNFVLKEGKDNKKAEVVFRQTIGSYALNTSFLSVGGSVKKWKYYAYGNFKTGNDWRPNSQFDVYSGGINLKRKLTKASSLKIEYTKMYYVTQQAGGLTDAQFNIDPSISIRERNWFKVDWNLAALEYNHVFKKGSKLNSRFFGLMASRDALGYLGQINRVDYGEERTLIAGQYLNYGNETRYLKKYDVKGKTCAFLIGGRFYHGYSEGRQGLASNGSDADFSFINDEVDGSLYKFPSKNYAGFVEHICHLTKKLSITPGVRYEWIDTKADGVFRNYVYDLAGNIVFDSLYQDSKSNSRGILIGGLGASYKAKKGLEIYGNFSQNYRSINFTDMQIQNPNYKIDPNLQDEKGFNADLGIRGKVGANFYYDVSGFLLAYNNRIGTTILTDSVWYTTYQYRTNISQSLTTGLELLVEADVWKLLVNDSSKNSLRVFTNLSLTDARYINSEEEAFQNKKVELVPPVNLKTGISYSRGDFTASYQFSYTASHFSDATNSTQQANAVNGLIPSYHISDLSLKYKYKWAQVEAGINNFTNTKYFTRRATGYPGPGIIPSAPRTYFATVQLTF